MSCYYSIAGSMKLRDSNDPALLEQINKVQHEEDSDLYAECVEMDIEGATLHIHIYGSMSYGIACEWDDEVKLLAHRYAAEPACFETECDGEHHKLFVGPAGFDIRQAEIDYIETKIAELRARQDELREETK